MSASVLEAQDAERRAKETEKGTRKALEAAEANKEAAEKKAAAAMEEAEELRRQVKALVSHSADACAECICTAWDH